jgi:hypothetical protein
VPAQLCILHARPAVSSAGRVAFGDSLATGFACERWTPSWEWADGGVYLDLTGTGRLHGRGLDGPARVCREMAPVWPRIAGGVAPTPLAAALASALAAVWDDLRTRRPGALLGVAPANVAAFLAPFSVGVLSADHPVAVRLLQRRGVRTLGDLQQVPPALLASLLGAEGARIAAEVAGQAGRALCARAPAEKTVVGLRLSRPLSGAGPRAALLRAVARRALLACLPGAGAWSAWTLRVRRGRIEDVATAVAPAREGGALEDCERLLDDLWRRLPPRRAGVTALRLAAGARRPQPAQPELFADDGSRLADAWRRVEARAPRALRLGGEALLERWGPIWEE